MISISVLDGVTAVTIQLPLHNKVWGTFTIEVVGYLPDMYTPSIP